MLNTIDFKACIQQNLKDKRYGNKRIAEIVTEFEERADFHRTLGLSETQANLLAMKDTFDNMSKRTAESAKRTAKMISVQAENNGIVRQGLGDVSTSSFLMDGKPGSKGTALARGAVSRLEDDPRFRGTSYSSVKEVNRGQLYAIFGDVLEKIGKGAFGMQKGAAHLPNIIREIKGQKTGDVAAKQFAQAWQKVQDLAVDLFNEAGGSMNKLANYVPQGMNAVKMVKAGKAKWTEAHMRALDWDMVRWPDGSIIPPDQRLKVLDMVFNTLSTNGANRIDANAFRGKGRALGNQLEQHRFLHYKDAQSWLDIHEQFGDGNVFDVFTRHIEDMAHRIALVETFGPNPEMTAQNMRAIVRKAAGELSAKDLADAEAVMNNKFDPMFETITRANAMDPHSTMGALVTGTSNILTSAMLGSASFLAIPGDFMQSVAVRALNKMDLFGGVGTYLKTLTPGALGGDAKGMRQLATQSGFIMDEVIMSTYSTTRFSGLATMGPTITRHVSEAVMRASLLSGHTRAARWAAQSEFMGLMQRTRGLTFENLPFREVLERYGVKPDEWDAFRQNVKEWTPRQDVSFMRPIDILKTELPNKQVLYRKFQSAIFEEARKMVPEATVEGAVALKDTTRPDTLVGALLSSFAMYKNFPVSFAMIYGRLGMTSPSVKGRLAFFAGLGAAMTVVGALGTQMREISRGREPLPMDNAAFLGKAFLSGGALSIWGDFLFSGINEFGRGPQDAVAGPLVSFMGDTTQLALGDVFQWADTVGGLQDKEFKSTSASKAVEWARRYTPGTSLWWARLALEREVWDRLQEVADPKAYSKRQKRVRNQRTQQGNDYYLAPGERTGIFGD